VVSATRPSTHQSGDDVIAYIESPLPGEPGAPETMGEEREDADDEE